MNILSLHSMEVVPQIEIAAASCKIAVVIPCYRVTPFVCDVIQKIGPEVQAIYCIDDACPDKSGEQIETQCDDPRVVVLFHPQNVGVGGAMLTGFRRALQDGANIVVKIDGDGQMDPAMIGRFVRPILLGRADYTKGNRFFKLDSLKAMPCIRLIGNAALSFITKLSSGYWNIMDPTNGYVAIHQRVLAEMPFEKISPRYFFESDMLFRLNTLGAVVEDVPMDASYHHPHSSLLVGQVWLSFLIKNLSNATKRIFYSHFLRNFSVASVELVIGGLCLLFGVVFGTDRWWHSMATGIPVTSGTVMLAGLPVMVGTQLLLSFMAYDMRNTPQVPLHKRL